MAKKEVFDGVYETLKTGVVNKLPPFWNIGRSKSDNLILVMGTDKDEYKNDSISEFHYVIDLVESSLKIKCPVILTCFSLQSKFQYKKININVVQYNMKGANKLADCVWDGSCVKRMELPEDEEKKWLKIYKDFIENKS